MPSLQNIKEDIIIITVKLTMNDDDVVMIEVMMIIVIMISFFNCFGIRRSNRKQFLKSTVLFVFRIFLYTSQEIICDGNKLLLPVIVAVFYVVRNSGYDSLQRNFSSHILVRHRSKSFCKLLYGPISNKWK